MTYDQEFRCADSDKWQNMHDVTDKIPAHAGPVDRSDPEKHPNFCNLHNCLKNSHYKFERKVVNIFAT